MTFDLFHEKAEAPGQSVENLAKHFSLDSAKLADNLANNQKFPLSLFLTKANCSRMSAFVKWGIF